MSSEREKTSAARRPERAEGVGGEPVASNRLVGFSQTFGLRSEVAHLGQELVDAHLDAPSAEPRGQLEQRPRRRLQAARTGEPGPVGRYLRIPLPREQLQHQSRIGLHDAMQQRHRRDLVVLEQVVTELVAGHESELIGLEGLQESGGEEHKDALLLRPHCGRVEGALGIDVDLERGLETQEPVAAFHDLVDVGRHFRRQPQSRGQQVPS